MFETATYCGILCPNFFTEGDFLRKVFDGLNILVERFCLS